MTEKTYILHYFTSEQRNELISKGFVLDEETKASETLAHDQSLRPIYEKMKAEYLGKTCNSKNCTVYNKHISKKPPYVFYADIGKYEVGDDGFLYFVLPPNTKMYKGTKYFYSSFPKTHFWVGCQKLAMDYAEWYGGGLNIYSNKKPVKLFVLNKENLEKVYDESTNQNAKDLLQMIYGVRISIEEQTKWICKKNPQWCGKIWLYDEHIGLRDDAKPNQYMPVWGSNLIHDYFYETYNFDGTFLEYFMSPFREIMDEEISLNIGLGPSGENLGSNIEMIKDDPDYWESWGLNIPPQDEFLLNETYPPNIGFRVNEWYQPIKPSKELFPLIPAPAIRILSYNLRSLVCANVLRSIDAVANDLLKLIELSDAAIIFLQEYPVEHLDRIKSLKNYQTIITTNGDEDLRLVALVNLNKTKFTKFDIIKDRKRAIRNSILLYFNDSSGKPIKIIGTHLEIGKRFMKNTRFVEYSDFYDIYKKNIKYRFEQLSKILSYKPDIIVGDFNFKPDDPEIKLMNQSGFTFSDVNETTSIFKKKVDYAFFGSNINGNESTIQYFESDHKPIIFDFNIPEHKSGGGVAGVGCVFNYTLIMFAIVILIVMLLVWYLFGSSNNDVCDVYF
jgi:endonuclease/exonuclease/phosphatase family metal-dependent hydrolase